ncbi:MAG: HAD family hydrolase [Acidimicrobiia bacterium]
MNSSPPIRSVIYDCDGVLVDSEEIANRALASLLTEAGVPTGYDETVDIFRGRSMDAILEIAAEMLDGPLPFDLSARYYETIKDVFERELKPVPGVIEALDRIDLPNCVASNGPLHKMEVTLRITGMWERFEGRIFSADEVAAGKPAPDLFLHAARKMGFVPSTTAVVEDSSLGVEAARAAGMRVFAYASHTTPEDLAAAGGQPFTDMADLPDLLLKPESASPPSTRRTG